MREETSTHTIGGGLVCSPLGRMPMLPKKTIEGANVSAQRTMNNEVREWLSLGQFIEEKAFQDNNQEILDLVHRFFSGVIQVKQLLDYFQKAEGNLEGVAEALGISRNAVYLRLKMVELTADHFRDKTTTLGSLIHSSPRLSSLLGQLREKKMA
jgi:hypothetical protein